MKTVTSSLFLVFESLDRSSLSILKPSDGILLWTSGVDSTIYGRVRSSYEQEIWVVLLNLGEARPWMLRDFGEDGREEGSIAGLESILVTVLDTVFFFVGWDNRHNKNIIKKKSQTLTMYDISEVTLEQQKYQAQKGSWLTCLQSSRG